MDLNVFQIPPITNVTIERQRWQEQRITLPTIKEHYFTHLFHILPTLTLVSQKRNEFLKIGLNCPMWRNYDVTATPKFKTKYIKLTVLKCPFVWAIASRRTIQIDGDIGQNVWNWHIFKLCPKMAHYLQLFLEQPYHQKMRRNALFPFRWYVGGGTASVKKVIRKKPRILGSRIFWHILAHRRGDNPIPTRELYCLEWWTHHSPHTILNLPRVIEKGVGAGGSGVNPLVSFASSQEKWSLFQTVYQRVFCIFSKKISSPPSLSTPPPIPYPSPYPTTFRLYPYPSQ